jgi:methyl-accepting chemotaxis protein
VVQQITGLAQQMSQALQQSQAAQEQAAQGIMTTVTEQIQPAMEALKKLTQQTLLNSQSISKLSQAVDQIGQELATNAAPIAVDPNAVVGGGVVPPQGMAPIA